MRRAETVLGIIHNRGQQGLHLEDVYRQLYNPNLYLKAYANIYSNNGATTQGSTDETIDGMSLEKIQQIIETLKKETYRWTPVRRTYIAKKNGKKRPLGIPSWSDKLLQEVIRLILEAYYEPQFSSTAHGFRAGRGCHTALREIERTWKGTHWFIEGDIKGCFDNIDHTILLETLNEKIHDNRFIRLVRHLLKSGYMEDWIYHKTHSGTPQGGICSPILANIYLDKLDKYIENILIPQHTKGKERKRNKTYQQIMRQARKEKADGNYHKARELRQQGQKLPALDPNDPTYERLRYIRYADDILLGYAGTKTNAKAIKQQIKVFLQDELKIELSEEKTLVTHAATERALFLGYEIHTQIANTKHSADGGRRTNGRIALKVPRGRIDEYCSEYMRRGKPYHRPELLYESDFGITSIYQSEYRGIVQYYMLAQNVSQFWKLHWVMQTSLLKTLANKHRVSTSKIRRKYTTDLETPNGTYRCLKVEIQRVDKPPLIAYFGGISLQRNKETTIVNLNPLQARWIGYNELTKRLLAQECELCGSTENIEVHHIRRLSDINRDDRRSKPTWMQVMIARRRKTLVVCKHCHINIHAGRPTKQKTMA